MPSRWWDAARFAEGLTVNIRRAHDNAAGPRYRVHMADFYFAGADESSAGRVFLVQLSLDACPSSDRFRGRIQHMLSCDATHFESLDELVQFMRFHVGDLADNSRTGVLIREAGSGTRNV